MCGIFVYCRDGRGNDKGVSQELLLNYFNVLKHRGPDSTQIVNLTPEILMGHHRLMINGLNEKSGQPMSNGRSWLVCNGEIYNYRELGQQYGFNYETDSDCEVILHLYHKLGMDATVRVLDGVFAFALYDVEKKELYVARDYLGIRPLYIGNNSGDYGFASEAKGLTFMKSVKHFPPRIWLNVQAGEFHCYYEFVYPLMPFSAERSISSITDNIRKLLIEAVYKRLVTSDVEVGCLLSGGLDSSLITAISTQLLEDGHKLKTFAIGLEGSPDLKCARKVAKWLGTDHHEVICTEQEFLETIDATIYTLGTYDVTTVRASVGNRLIAKYVRKNTDVKVLFTGEIADESSGSYLYFANAPSPTAFQEECIRLLKDVHYFDNLRSDRSISGAGLEARLPFSDRAFLAYYMSIPPELKMFGGNGKIEKYLLRKAFEGYLPEDILWRRKNGFSDSVSNSSRSWVTIITEMVDRHVSDDEFSKAKSKYKYDAPKLKEGYYYRMIFDRFYKGHEKIVPYQWLPKWCGDQIDPSGRQLSLYDGD